MTSARMRFGLWSRSGLSAASMSATVVTSLSLTEIRGRKTHIGVVVGEEDDCVPRHSGRDMSPSATSSIGSLVFGSAGSGSQPSLPGVCFRPH